MNFSSLVRNKYYELTPSERKVADYILVTGAKIIFNTMNDIKKHTKVGDATIIRFCQKLGFSGFSDLKIEIAKEDFNQTARLTKEDTYLERVGYLQEIIQATARQLDKGAMALAVKQLAQARHIYIFGVGGSGQSSLILESMFLRVGLKAHAVIDSHYQAQVAAILDQRDLVIVFSLSGRTLDSLAAAKIAKQNGVPIIAITTHLNSPLAREADIILQTVVDEFLNGGSLVGKLSQQVVCDLLIWEYSKQEKIDTTALREKILRSILPKRSDLE